MAVIEVHDIGKVGAGQRSEDEGLFVRQHEFWAKSLREAILRNSGDATDVVPVQGEAA